MSRKSSCASISQKVQQQGEPAAQDIEEESEAGHTSAPNTHVEVKAAVVSDANELRYTAPPTESRISYAKTTLPLPAPPPKKSPQMAFDFNAVACKEVAAQELNLEVRDEYGLNKDLKTGFLEIFGEPDPQYHSVACVWACSFRVFEVTRIYCYKILTLILGLPIAFIAGLIFALFSFLRIWIIQPCLALVRIALAQALTIWPMFLLYIVRPLFYSVGAMFSTFRLHRTEGQVIKEVWERV